MPNWCENELRVTGPDAPHFLAQAVVNQSDRGRDFIARLLPCPPELERVMLPVHIVDAGERRRALRAQAGTFPITAAMQKRYLSKFGHDNWYDWCYANWGTKWGACDSRVEGETVFFDTAWSPPLPAIVTISQQFPECTFKLKWLEGGCAFRGYAIVKNGQTLKYRSYDYKGKRGG